MLREYGQFERVEGQLIAVPLPDTDQTEKEVLNKMEYHLALSPKITVMKGQTKRVYLLLRGSSTYNTEEMARLISGLIEDCRDSGIPDSEIMTPFEKQKLFEQYGIGGEHEQKDKGFAVQTGC
nr:MAG TPA: NinB protein [Caudoviricetes sp.]